SVAYELAPGFKATGRVTVFDAAVPACAFPPTIAASYRNPLTNAMLSERPCHPSGEAAAEDAFQPDIVVWLVSDPPGPWRYQGRSVHACSQPYDSIYKTALGDELDRLQRRGTRVVLTTEAYVRFTRSGNGMDAIALPDHTVDCNNRLRREIAARKHLK